MTVLKYGTNRLNATGACYKKNIIFANYNTFWKKILDTFGAKRRTVTVDTCHYFHKCEEMDVF